VRGLKNPVSAITGNRFSVVAVRSIKTAKSTAFEQNAPVRRCLLGCGLCQTRTLSRILRQVYASLSATNQHILSTQIKDKNGQPASCDFQGGLLDILANYTPNKRDADFKQLLDKMLIHTPECSIS